MNKRKRKKKANNTKRYIGRLVSVPEKNRYPVLVQLCQAPWHTSYDVLARGLRLSEKKTRQLIEEFQLFEFNPYSDYILDKASIAQVNYLYPTVAQFYSEEQRGYVNQLDLLKNVLSETATRPHSDLIKKNVLIRTFYSYKNQSNKEISENLRYSTDYIGRFKKEFINVIESEDQEKIWSFGVKCGLHDQRERYRNIVVYLCYAFFYLSNKTYWLNYLEHKRTGILTDELNKSFFNVMRMIKDKKEKLTLIDPNDRVRYRAAIEALEALIKSARLMSETKNELVLSNVGLSTY